MSDSNYAKQIRKFYEEKAYDGEEFIKCTYCIWNYRGDSVRLVNMLADEVLKDFPDISMDDIHMQRRASSPFELTLNVTYALSDIQTLDLSRFERIPEDFWK